MIKENNAYTYLRSLFSRDFSLPPDHDIYSIALMWASFENPCIRFPLIIAIWHQFVS